MRSSSLTLVRAFALSLLALPMAMPLAVAGDLGVRSPLPAAPLPTVPEWSFRLTPYAWAMSLQGTQTTRGRSAAVNVRFLDILEESDSLLAFMGAFEARRGPWSLYGDVVWSKITVEGSGLRTRSLGPLNAGLAASLGLDMEMGTLEAGIGYEVLRRGALSVDVIGGVRHWFQKADLALDLAAAIGEADLDVVGARAFARSGSVSWTDPVIGARVRWQAAPGHDLFLRADIGGFGVGSRFSWQAMGGYALEFARQGSVTYSAILGYRALSVDYAQGDGRTRYEFDMLQHGPIVGVSLRF